jgi:GNAT superfamily N-acetyltransferase
MNLVVDRAGVDDLAVLVELFDGYRQFYGQASDPSRAEDFLGERMARGESVILLARLGGQAAGFVQLYPIFSSVHTARVWLLNDLFVATTARRQGVARALLVGAGDFARADGARGLQLETGRDNIEAQQLYEACGWRRDHGSWWYTWQP